MADVEIQIPPRSVYVGVIRLAVASLARTAGFDEALVDDLKIAVGEACTNAVLSNEEVGATAPISVCWSEEPGRIVMEVSDSGVPPDAGPDADSAGMPSRLVLSTALLESLVDRCEIEPRPEGGTRARLIVNRDQTAQV